jgi:hypothetical protein
MIWLVEHFTRPWFVFFPFFIWSLHYVILWLTGSSYPCNIYNPVFVTMSCFSFLSGKSWTVDLQHFNEKDKSWSPKYYRQNYKLSKTNLSKEVGELMWYGMVYSCPLYQYECLLYFFLNTSKPRYEANISSSKFKFKCYQHIHQIWNYLLRVHLKV